MVKRIAAISDVHGCIEELRILYNQLSWLSLDEIWHLGDLVDRGPDSGAVVAFCRENHIAGVLGNHEESILKHWDRVQAGGDLPSNLDKRRTISQLSKADIEYIRELPTMHVIDDLNLVLVHGGLFPTIPLYQQPKNVIRAQMIHPQKPGDCRWWGPEASNHKSGRTEEQNLQDGYQRWYKLYDHKQHCVYGHSVFSQPFIHQNSGAGMTVGIDNGSCFGGMLTAAIFDGGAPCFLSVKAKKVWFEKSYRIHQDEL